jgi:hypothetical protein
VAGWILSNPCLSFKKSDNFKYLIKTSCIKEGTENKWNINANIYSPDKNIQGTYGVNLEL